MTLNLIKYQMNDTVQFINCNDISNQLRHTLKANSINYLQKNLKQKIKRQHKDNYH